MLAAGAGRRFGAAKQLAELDGRPLLEHALGAMAAAGLDQLVVVLGAEADKIRERVDLRGARVVVCPSWSQGQAASLRAGVAALRDAEAVVVALGDQPGISAQAVERLLAARGDDVLAVRASYGGVPAHPVVLERPLINRLGELRGDAGARDLLAAVAVRHVTCDGLGHPADVDTPADLERLRSGNTEGPSAGGLAREEPARSRGGRNDVETPGQLEVAHT